MSLCQRRGRFINLGIVRRNGILSDAAQRLHFQQRQMNLRQHFVERPAELVEILHEGSRRARKIAQRTMDEVREVVRLEP